MNQLTHDELFAVVKKHEDIFVHAVMRRFEGVPTSFSFRAIPSANGLIDLSANPEFQDWLRNVVNVTGARAIAAFIDTIVDSPSEPIAVEDTEPYEWDNDSIPDNPSVN